MNFEGMELSNQSAVDIVESGQCVDSGMFAFDSWPESHAVNVDEMDTVNGRAQEGAVVDGGNVLSRMESMLEMRCSLIYGLYLQENVSLEAKHPIQRKKQMIQIELALFSLRSRFIFIFLLFASSSRIIYSKYSDSTVIQGSR